MVTLFDALKTFFIFRQSCKKVKTREFKHNQTLSTLARRLEPGPSLPKASMSGKVVHIAIGCYLSRPND